MKILLLVLLISSFCFGQNVGQLSGNLVNDSLKAIPNAYIFVGMPINHDSFEDVMSLRTDREGCFLINELPTGSYQLRIQMSRHEFSNWMELDAEITSNVMLHLDEMIYQESVLCMCSLEYVEYKPPLIDPFGRSITITSEDIKMR